MRIELLNITKEELNFATHGQAMVGQTQPYS